MPAPSAGLEQQQVQDRSDTAAAAILRAGRLIWAIGVTLIVITLLGCGVTIWDLHDETIEQQRLAVRNLGFVLAEQTARYVQVVDLVLQEIQSRSATLVASSPDRLPQTFGAEQTRDFLRDRLKNLPQANAFFLLNSDGRTVVTSRTQAGGNLDFSGRDYYRHFIEQNDPNPFISSPMNSRVVGTPTVYLARRINGSRSHAARCRGRRHRSAVHYRLLPGDRTARRRDRDIAASGWTCAGTLSRSHP